MKIPSTSLPPSQPPKAAYEATLQDLTRVYEVYISLKGGTDISWERKMADLVLSIRDYLQARKDMMDLYHSRKPQLFLCIYLSQLHKMPIKHILEEITLLECINVTAS